MACQARDEVTLKAALAVFTDRIDAMRLPKAAAAVERLPDFGCAWRIDIAVRWANASGLSLDDIPTFDRFDTYHICRHPACESRQANSRHLVPGMAAMAARLESLVMASRRT